MIAIMVTHPGWWLLIWLIFLAAYCFGATMQRGSNYSRGWEAGYLKAMADIEEEQADGREIIPATGSPFVKWPVSDALPVDRDPAAEPVAEVVYADGRREKVYGSHAG